MAMDIARFMPLERFQTRMDDYIERLHESPKALDREQIFVHGEKEFIRTEMHEKSGIPIADNVFNTLTRIATDCGTKPPVSMAEP